MKNCLTRISVFGLLRTALWTVLGMVCLASATAMAQRDMGCSPTVANPCDGGGDSGNPGNNSGNRRQSSDEDAERTARNAIVARYNAKIDESDAALKAGRYREAARLRREAVSLREPLGENDKSRQALVNAERYERYADADDAAKAGNSAVKAGNHALALEYYRTMIRDPGFDNEANRKVVADLQARVQAEQERIKRETEAADRERRHRPEVERLRAEAKAMMDLRPADALAKLDAALKLLPGDSKTTGDRWLAKASLDLREAKYDEAMQAVQNAQNFAGDSPEIARARTQVADERKRQGANVQNAFGELRQRLAAAANADTTAVDAGAQLKSVERHSSDARSQRKDSDKETARKGFDIPGSDSGNLVYPDKNKHRQLPPSALDRQIPRGAKGDPQVKEMQAWYRSLDARKAEKEQMIAEIKEQQKTAKDPLLETKITTLTNDVKRLADDQGKATATVKERVEVIKKQMLDKGLVWDESPLPAPAQTPEYANSTASQSSPAKLDFIRD